MLEGAWNHARRRDALAQLGFAGLPAARGPLTSHDVVLVAGLVFLAMLFVPLMMRRFIDPLPLPQNLRILVTVPIVYAIAIVAAIYPKSVWPFAARQPGGERPFAAYAVSGVIAAAASFVVSLVFRFVFDKSGNIFQSLSTPGAFQEAWTTTLVRWPWLLMTFFITVAVAWTADDREPADPAGRLRLRAIEAASLAIALGLVQWSVLQLLAGASPEMAARLSRGGAAHRRHRDRGGRLHRLAGADDAPLAQPGRARSRRRRRRSPCPAERAAVRRLSRGAEAEELAQRGAVLLGAAPGGGGVRCRPRSGRSAWRPWPARRASGRSATARASRRCRERSAAATLILGTRGQRVEALGDQHRDRQPAPLEGAEHVADRGEGAFDDHACGFSSATRRGQAASCTAIAPPSEWPKT